MSTPRRNKALSPEGQTAKFLYCIIKQLNLKSIDWTIVAASLDITNGHAARMRYSRFKQQMEGLASQSKAPKPTGKKGKQEKEGYEKPTKGKKRANEDEEPVKSKPGPKPKSEQAAKAVSTPPLKEEGVNGKLIKLDPDANPPASAPTSTPTITSTPIKPEPDPPIKSEPEPSFVAASAPQAPPQVEAGAVPQPSPNPDFWRLLPRSNPSPTLACDPLSQNYPIGSFTTAGGFGMTSPPPDFSSPPYGTVSLSDVQLSPRSFAPANMIPTSPGSLAPRIMPSDELDGLGDLDLDMDMGDFLQDDVDGGGLEEGGWIITGEGKVGGGS